MGYVDNAGRGDRVGVWACVAPGGEDGVEGNGSIGKIYMMG